MKPSLIAAATTALLLTAPPAEAKRQLPDRVCHARIVAGAPNPCAPSGPPQTVPGQGGVRR